MMNRFTRFRPPAAALIFLGHSRFVAALTVSVIGAAFFTHALESTIGQAGHLAILVGLVVLTAMSMIALRGTFEWRGVLPISLLAFVGWSAASIVWSNYQWATLGALTYQLIFAFLALFVALARDLIQIVRAFGDVLRVVLGVSLALELLSGLLLDLPIAFLGISGRLDQFGPIEGVMGSRNMLGFTALIALVTFGTELFTKSVNRSLGIWSIVGASLAILLSQSPVTFSTLLALGVMSLALMWLRRMPPEPRRIRQFTLAGGLVVAAGLAFLFRSQLLAALNASAELDYRVDVWRQVVELVRLHPLEGWGWVGTWNNGLPPYVAVTASGGNHVSALNAYLDVWLQLGLIGFLALMVLAVLALARSWLLASNRRSRSFVWPALIVVTLLVTALAESSVLVDAGWLVLVVCAVKSAENLSWRRSLPESATFVLGEDAFPGSPPVGP